MEYKAHINRPEDIVNNMDISKISKIDTAKFFKNTELHELNNLIISIAKKVFVDAYNNNGKEAGAVIDLDKLTYSFKKHLVYGRVSFGYCEYDDNECYDILSNSNNYSCITLHTHNNISVFSVGDIYSLLSDMKVIAMVVIASNANVYIMYKQQLKNYEHIISYIENMLEDYITPELMRILEENELFIRRITQ